MKRTTPPVTLEPSALEGDDVPDLLKKAALAHSVYSGTHNFHKISEIRKAFVLQLKKIINAKVNNEKIKVALNTDLYSDSHKNPVTLLEQICKAIHRHYIQGKYDAARITVDEYHLNKLNASPAKVIRYIKNFQPDIQDIMEIKPYVENRNVVLEFFLKW